MLIKNLEMKNVYDYDHEYLEENGSSIIDKLYIICALSYVEDRQVRIIINEKEQKRDFIDLIIILRSPKKIASETSAGIVRLC